MRAEAITATGETVPTPPFAHHPTWLSLVARVAVLPGGCHLWLGAVDGDGYGHLYRVPPIAWNGQPAAARPGDLEHPVAHRYTVGAWCGPLPATDLVRHTCNERLCVPVTQAAVRLHLALGSHGHNADDRAHAGRTASRRHGIAAAVVDTRPAPQRSRFIRDAVRAALHHGATGADLTAVYASAVRVGDPYRDQLTLISVPS